jgi:hypothetical protein
MISAISDARNSRQLADKNKQLAILREWRHIEEITGIRSRRWCVLGTEATSLL